MPRAIAITLDLLADACRFLRLLAVPKAELAAQNLVLQKELALFKERKVEPRRFQDADRIVVAVLASAFDTVKDVLTVVTPQTVLRWQKKLWALYWRHKSRPRGRPPIPPKVQRLIAQMSRDNPTWGRVRIKNEMLLKFGIEVDEDTVAKYMHGVGRRGRGRTVSPQRWSTFVHNHARGIVACDFVTVVAVVNARFRIYYVLVVLEIGSRKILHTNVTDHPTSAWTAQQLREAIPDGHGYDFLIHDRDAIFSVEVDRVARGIGLRVLRTPPRTPKANAFCERVIGTLRRECLDFFIALGDQHLRRILREYVSIYNRSRPHMSLGPGIPDPAEGLPVARDGPRRNVPEGYRVVATPILGGLHHDYRLEKIAA